MGKLHYIFSPASKRIQAISISYPVAAFVEFAGVALFCDSWPFGKPPSSAEFFLCHM